MELWVLTNGYIFVEASLIEDILFDVDIIISLLLFKHRIVNNRTAIISFQFDNVTFINSIILMNNYRITFLLNTMKLLDSANCHLITTQAHKIAIYVLIWIDMKCPGQIT